MNKKYPVRLSAEARGVCQEIVKRLKGTSEKVKRAQRLLSNCKFGDQPVSSLDSSSRPLIMKSIK